MRGGWAPDGFFVLRTPLLPFDELRAWGAGLEAAGVAEAGGDLEAACARDRDRLQTRLRAVLARPEVREALFVASPSLSERIAVWEADPAGERGVSVEAALVKYFQRMAFRCTPFGLFAGCSVGRLGERTAVHLGARASYRRHTRLDMGFLTAAVERLERAPALRDGLAWFPNSSLYRIADRLRYAESRGSGGARSYFLVDVRLDEPLALTLTRAAGGATRAALVAALASDGSEREEAEVYVDELIDGQLLVSRLAPPVTGAEAIDGVLAQLGEVASAASAHALLTGVRAGLRELDSGGLGSGTDVYLALKRSVDPLPVRADPARLFQVDMRKPATRAELGREVLEELEAAVTLVARLSPAREDGPLEAFRRAFEERWGDREVPLAAALDEETGLGFDSADHVAAAVEPLLEGVPLGGPSGPPTVRWDGRATWLRGKLDRALLEGAQEILLEDEDLPPVRSGSPPLADALSVLASLREPRGPGDPVAELIQAGGPSGARLLGRFCHGDPELLAAVRAHVAAEEALAPDVTFFEIAHLPEGRLGNVISRPLFREHELAYLGRSGAPPERTLSIADLSVSVRKNRVVLRSLALGREVRPRLTCAHNTRFRSVAVYRFLAAVQDEGVLPGAAWSWSPFDGSLFLPRVRYRRVILAPRQWTVTARELEGVRIPAVARELEGVRFAAVAHWRRARGLPRLVGLVDSDHVLPVDLENVLSVDAFVGLVRRRSGFRLVEIPDDGLAVRGPEGRFRNEIVVPYVRRREAGSAGVAAPSRASGRPPRSVRNDFAPGSEWLFAKIYVGPATADAVLREVIRPLVGTACGSSEAPVADGWFFLRYGDPGWHLRVRFHGPPAALTGQLLPALHEGLVPYIADGRVSRLVLDTYRREAGRYGGSEGVVLCERLFRHDSEAVLGMLAGLEGDEGADLRWRLALVGVDRLLGDFGFNASPHFAWSRVTSRRRVHSPPASPRWIAVRSSNVRSFGSWPGSAGRESFRLRSRRS